ncbi:DUF7511 domain-containing protein [Natronosalvus halobius]|uniref:DUF7511 domain-containing protein n=1 Tax=Natronosalvus halobius TaxID=2953746 RepID=UPI00209E8A9F|nr:hypothetical protein [Natronosalvus halobius]USZ73074.1 hypothetical protein NGM15_07160 [Natronosalvus halobius]
MTVSETPVESPTDRSADVLELLTDEAGTWTMVPMSATGDERMTQWISVDSAVLCDLEEMR